MTVSCLACLAASSDSMLLQLGVHCPVCNVMTHDNQVLVLSNEGSFDPHSLLVKGGMLVLSSPVAEAAGARMCFFSCCSVDALPGIPKLWCLLEARTGLGMFAAQTSDWAEGSERFGEQRRVVALADSHIEGGSASLGEASDGSNSFDLSLLDTRPHSPATLA